MLKKKSKSLLLFAIFLEIAQKTVFKCPSSVLG